MHRVLITGIGIVSPIGIGRKTFWEHALNGTTGVRRLALDRGGDLPVTIGGRVVGFDAEGQLGPGRWNRLSRFAQFALAAALQAVSDAGLRCDTLPGDRSAVFMGVSMSGMEMVEELVATCREGRPGAVKRYWATGSYPGAAAGNIAIRMGLYGESTTISNGCSSATTAIGQAFRGLRCGEYDMALAGGAEACLTPSYMASLGKAGILSRRNDDPTRASRPYDRDRDGYVLGEGAAVLLLETRSSALRRSARPFAEIIGYGTSCDAYSMVAVDPEGRQADRAIRAAFHGARRNVEDVDFISAHGSSSVVSDRREARLINRVFGAGSRRIPVASIKSMIGHPLGACGGFQAAVCALAIRSGAIHPTINHETPDPECDIDCVSEGARCHRVQTALALSLGMGGINSVLLLAAP